MTTKETILIGLIITNILIWGFILAHQKPAATQEISFPSPWFMPETKSPSYSVACAAMTCEVYFTDSIDMPINYMELIRLIETAPKEATINLHLAGNGGVVVSVVAIGNAIELSKAQVNTIVEGPVYSAHAYLAMMGKHIIIGPYNVFMFHVPAVILADKMAHMPNDDCFAFMGMKDRNQDSFTKCINGNNAEDVMYNNMFKKYVFKYMTATEIADMKAGEDIYITDMTTRIERVRH